MTTLEATLKDVIENRVASLQQEIAQCSHQDGATVHLQEQLDTISRLREHHEGRPRPRYS